MFYGKYYDNYSYFGIFHGYFGFQLREWDFTRRNIRGIYPTKF